ncbi:hypothetical protein Tco_1191598 [Tanacetum coccineum]
MDNATNATSGNEDVSQATSGHGINDVGSDDGNKAAYPKPMSFASVVNSKQVCKKVNFRALVNEERVDNHDTCDTNLKKEVSMAIPIEDGEGYMPKQTISEPAADYDNHGDCGIRLNKPKPNFYRPKPAKENDHGKGASSMTKERETNGSNNIKSRVNSFEALNSLESEDGNVDHIAKEVNEG